MSIKAKAGRERREVIVSFTVSKGARMTPLCNDIRDAIVAAARDTPIRTDPFKWIGAVTVKDAGKVRAAERRKGREGAPAQGGDYDLQERTRGGERQGPG